MHRAQWLLGILVVLCAVGAVRVRAAHASPVSEQELRARQDYAAGRYDEAIEIFAELFAKTADPIFLRNIARCYQKQNRADEAITNFREYLKKAKKLAPGEKDEIEGYIHDLEASRAAPKPAPAATPPAPPAAVPPAPVVAKETPPAPPPRASEPRADVRASTEPGAHAGSSVSVPGVALTLVGLAAVGGGVAFGLAAHSAASAVASQYDPNRDAAGKRDATLQWVGYGVGAAALVAGVIFLLRGPSESPAASQARLDLGVFPGGASLSGRF